MRKFETPQKKPTKTRNTASSKPEQPAPIRSRRKRAERDYTSQDDEWLRIGWEHMEESRGWS